MELYLSSDLIEVVQASSKINANVPIKKQIICTYVIKRPQDTMAVWIKNPSVDSLKLDLSERPTFLMAHKTNYYNYPCKNSPILFLFYGYFNPITSIFILFYSH